MGTNSGLASASTAPNLSDDGIDNSLGRVEIENLERLQTRRSRKSNVCLERMLALALAVTGGLLTLSLLEYPIEVHPDAFERLAL